MFMELGGLHSENFLQSMQHTYFNLMKVSKFNIKKTGSLPNTVKIDKW